MKTIPNPFTPKTGWEPKIIVGRDSELEFFARKLYEAKRGRCDHFVILGDWGMGKTSLLNKFKVVAESMKIFTAMVSVSEFTEKHNDLDGIKFLVEQIPRKFPIEMTELKNFTRKIRALDVEILGKGLNFSKKIDGMFPQTLLTDVLTSLWEDMREQTEAAVILLDDVQNFLAISGIFTILKNVLADEQMTKGTKFLFVLSTIPAGWEKFKAKNHPIGRYFSPRLHLQKLTKNDMKKVIAGNLEETGVIFEDEVIKRVINYVEGNPYELQHVCANLFEKQIGGKVTLIKKINEDEIDIF